MTGRYGDYPYGHGLNSGPNRAGIIEDQPVVVTAGRYRGCPGYRTTYPDPAPGLVCIRLAAGYLLHLGPDQYEATREAPQ